MYVCLSDQYKAQFVQFVQCMKSPAFRQDVEKSLETEKVNYCLLSAFVPAWV